MQAEKCWSYVSNLDIQETELILFLELNNPIEPTLGIARS